MERIASGDSASVQAVKNMNAAQAPKRRMQEPTRPEVWGRPKTMKEYERTRFIGPAGVMATACRQRGSDATREAPSVIAIRINGQLARDRPGRMGWRRGP
jgi:hypothetical protein